MFLLRRRNNGQAIALVSTNPNAVRTNAGTRKASAVITDPVAKHQIVKTKQGSVVVHKEDILYTLANPNGQYKAMPVFLYKWPRLKLWSLQLKDLVASVKARWERASA